MPPLLHFVVAALLALTADGWAIPARLGRQHSSARAAASSPAVNEEVRLLILCGLPGSGKSTLAAALRGNNWRVVNQDTMGNRRACERACAAALAAGERVVVDRCNHDAQQRAHWVRLLDAAGGGRAYALWLDVDEDECVARCRARRGHRTLPPEKAARVIRGFRDTWVPPDATSDGLAGVLRLPIFAEGDAGRVVASLDDLPGSWVDGAG